VHKNFGLFRGIPYASAPVRERRWQEMEPVTEWHGDLIATRSAIEVIRLSGHTYTV
jgi:carboxylesterase type B